MSMDDMLKEAEKYSGKTRSLADIVDQMHGTYEDKILPQFGGKRHNFWRYQISFIKFFPCEILIDNSTSKTIFSRWFSSGRV